MTVASEIEKLQTNLNNAYDSLEQKGATLPSSKNFDNLADAIANLKVGGDIMQDDLEIIPDIEDGTTEEAQYDIFTSPFTDTQGVVYDGVSRVKVRKIGSWIDSHLSADNIRKDTVVLGVKGNLVELVPETISVSANTSLQTFTPSTGNGFTEVKVNAITLQDKTVVPSSSRQTVHHDSNYTGLNSVTVEPVDATADANIKAENIKEDVTILGVTGTFAGKKIDSYKTVTPTTSYQTVRPDEGFDGISYVNVNPVSYNIDSNITAANIKKDVNILGITGTYEGVERVYKTLNVTPKITTQSFTPDKGVDGFNKVEISAVTSSIDANILPKNIKRGINILGVEGNYIPENLQSKVVNPTTAVQNVTYDDGYEGLNNVQINAVTSDIDENITAENIKAGISILGVDGTLEEGIKENEVEAVKTITPAKTPIIVKPNEGFKALSQVNVEGVTAAIDTNILAENIKKGIEILGVTGSLDTQQKIIQDKKEVEPKTTDQVVSADSGYDALLSVIVKAVTASIDPNILPQNIKKNIEILGVAGTLEEGEAQKWFDFTGLSGTGSLTKNIDNGGTIASAIKLIENNWELNKLFSGMPEGKVPSNINAALFDLVFGYDNLEVTNTNIEQLFVYFSAAQLYTDYSKVTRIEEQIKWLYPFVNDDGVDGCLLNYTDTGEAKTLKLYVLTDTTEVSQPIPVLVDGTMSAALLPEDYDGFRYVLDMNIPEHVVFDPKIKYFDGYINNTVAVGSPVYNNGSVSNFTTSDYLERTFDSYGSNNLEMVFKFTTGDDVSGQYLIFEAGHYNSNNVRIQIYQNYMYPGVSVNGSWLFMNNAGSVQANTTYWFKFKYDSSYPRYYAYLSTDGKTYNQTAYWSYSSYPTNMTSAKIGVSCDVSAPFNGSIDLKESYLLINGQKSYFAGSSETLNWVLQARKGVSSIVHINDDKPLTIDVSAYDKNYGEEDTGKSTITEYKEFEYPTLSSNGTLGGDSFAVVASGETSGHYAYHAFDHNSSTYWRGSAAPGYIEFYNPTPIILSKITWGYFWNYPTAGEVKGSNDGSSWTTVAEFTNDTAADFDIDLSNNETAYKYYQIYVSSLNMDVIHTSGLTLMTKSTRTINVSSHTIYPLTKNLMFFEKSDERGNLVNYTDDGSAVDIKLYRTNDMYVFAPDENLGEGYENIEYIDTIAIPEHKVFTLGKIYTDWTQPLLTSNGTMGGNSFAVNQSSSLSGREAYMAFNGDKSTYGNNWHSGSGHPAYIEWYNPDPLKISNIQVLNRDSDGSFINEYKVSYSDDYSTWTDLVSGTSPSQSAYTTWDIAITEENPHNYWRLTSISSSGSNGGYTSIQLIKITAQAYVTAFE